MISLYNYKKIVLKLLKLIRKIKDFIATLGQFIISPKINLVLRLLIELGRVYLKQLFEILITRKF